MSVANAGKLSGELLARYDGANTRYYHFDALGSTVLVTNGSGSSVGSYAYGAWGSLAGTTGATVYPYLYVGQLGYYTHTSDQGAEVQSWLNLGVRFYDPEIGRFNQADLAGAPDGPNRYIYAVDRPFAFTDASGLKCKKIKDWHEVTEMAEKKRPISSRETTRWIQTGSRNCGTRGVFACECLWTQLRMRIDTYAYSVHLQMEESCQYWNGCGYDPAQRIYHDLYIPHTEKVPTLLPGPGKTAITMGMPILTNQGCRCQCKEPKS